MIDPGPQGVAGCAPYRADDRLAAMQHPDRCGEHREAVDEIGRPVDRIDRPDEVTVGTRPLLALFADDVVAGKLLGEPFADQFLDLAVDFGNRVFPKLAVGCAGLVAHRENAAERAFDFSAREVGNLDRKALDLVELIDGNRQLDVLVHCAASNCAAACGSGLSRVSRMWVGSSSH
jgi:hypothetical protein